MPIPLIVWGVGLGATALAGVIKSGSAVKRISKAKKRYEARRLSYETIIKEYEERHKYTSQQFDESGKIRLEAMVTLGEVVKFLEKAKLKERDLIEKFQITPQKLLEWKKASINAISVIGGAVGSAVSGVTTAAGAYGLVGVLATASTGTAIGTLSGAAATNATLAWLGGGTLAAGGGGMAAGAIVLGGIIVAPALLVASFFAGSKASDVETQVEKNIAEIDIDEANKRKLMATLHIVVKRIHELRDATIKVRDEIVALLRKCNPNVLEDAYLVARSAKGLGELLEISIIDKDGNLIEP